MRPWLLLLSLLVSELSPPGDGVLDYNSLTSCRKLEIHCMCIQGNCVYMTAPLYWGHKVHDEHGCSLSHLEFTGKIHRKAPAVSVSLGQRKSVPASILPMVALHVISARDIIKDRPDSWELNHHTDASGRNFRGFLLEKSKNWATASIVQVQKMLTKRFCVIISCCFKEDEVKLAKKEAQISENGQAVVSQRDDFQAGTETSHMSQLQLDIQRNSIIIKKNEHLNLLQQRVQGQSPLNSVSSLDDDDDDGFYAKKQLLLASGETKKSINGPRRWIKATQDDNKEDFNGKKQAELRLLERGSEKGRLQIANVNQRRLAYILQAARKTDNNDVHQKLSEAAQTEVNTDTGWGTINIHIKELGDPLENFIVEVESLKDSGFSLEICARTERIDIKAAESKETKASEEQVKETIEESEHTEADNHTPHESMGINHAKQKENVPSLETKTEPIAVNTEIKETTTSVDVFTQGGTVPSSTETLSTTTSPESETESNETGDIRATTVESFSGLRMRPDVLAETERKEGRNDPEVDSFTSAKPLQTIHEQAFPKTTDATVSPCRGLIHRTEAGRRHCMERAAGTGSQMLTSSEATDLNNDDDDEYDHFYYFDGVLRRVQNNFYPNYKRQNRPKTSYDNTENFLSYIRRHSLQDKVNYLK